MLDIGRIAAPIDRGAALQQPMPAAFGQVGTSQRAQVARARALTIRQGCGPAIANVACILRPACAPVFGVWNWESSSEVASNQPALSEDLRRVNEGLLNL